MWARSLYLQQEEKKRKVTDWSFVQKYSEFKISILYHLEFWVFGLCVLSSIKKTREHTISDIGSVSVW
jgi:hypothetical protein